MGIKFTRIPENECIAVATLALEGFTPGHRSLEVVLYACPNHEDDAWENWGFSDLWKYRKEYAAKGEKTDHRCGDLVDFRDEKPDETNKEREAMAPEGLFPEQLRLEINGEPVETGSLAEIRAAVAELVTGWLADDPEGLAVDAQTCNMAFNTGAVQEALDLRGEWYTVVGMHSDHQTMRVRVTKEG